MTLILWEFGVWGFRFWVVGLKVWGFRFRVWGFIGLRL